jgi:hypothetical protein
MKLFASYKTNCAHIVLSQIILPLGATQEILLSIKSYNAWLASLKNDRITVLPAISFDNDEYKPSFPSGPMYFISDTGLKKYRSMNFKIEIRN